MDKEKNTLAVSYLVDQLLNNQTFENPGYINIDISIEHFEWIIGRALVLEKNNISEAHSNASDGIYTGRMYLDDNF